jgi:aspartyl-tRNA(Asn)/glutamyl-tRNA(Gln) amidotransferase subunit C
MSSVTIDQIQHVARLARLRFAPDEMAGFAEQFNQIVSYVEQLNKVDTTGVEPLANVLDIIDSLRDDEPGPLLSPAEALRNAPKKTEGFFTVPKVIGDMAE